MGLTVEDRIKMLEALAADEELKATQRLRALEELGRIEARRTGAAAASVEQDDDEAPDPMADLDEMEALRRKRQRRRAS